MYSRKLPALAILTATLVTLFGARPSMAQIEQIPPVVHTQRQGVLVDLNPRGYMTFEDMTRMKALYSSLLPAYRVRNDATGHYLHLRDSLKALTTADMTAFARDAGKLNFRKGWHPKPYSTEYEDAALFQLGVLASLGHATIVNSNIPELKEYAKTIVGQLIKVSQDTYLTDLTSDLNAVLQAVSDPTYAGGPTKALERYDSVVTRLSVKVGDIYLKDGFWYYTAGITLGGLHAIPGHDWFHAPYFRDMLQALYDHYPSKGLPYPARTYMVQILRSDFQFTNPRLSKQSDLAQKAIWVLYPFSRS